MIASALKLVAVFVIALSAAPVASLDLAASDTLPLRVMRAEGYEATATIALVDTFVDRKPDIVLELIGESKDHDGWLILIRRSALTAALVEFAKRQVAPEIRAYGEHPVHRIIIFFPRRTPLPHLSTAEEGRAQEIVDRLLAAPTRTIARVGKVPAIRIPIS